MQLKARLRQCGLSEKEASLYLATLELGSASVQKIAQKADVVRSTAYEVLETLRGQGFVTTFLKKKARYYSAQDPAHVLRMLEGKIELFKEALPEMNALIGEARHRPTVRFYQGNDELNIVLKEVLDEADELLGFSSIDDLWREFDHMKFVRERMKRKIPARIILRDSERARQRRAAGPTELRQVRIMNGALQYHGAVYIWKNKVAMFSFLHDIVGVVIESREIAETERAMFEQLWLLLEKR
ncbi:MAG: helix-turn-helix domain-containing protein [Patescibacteria group bacterium]